LPQEIKALGADKEIIFVEGAPRPILADKIRYYEDAYFKSRMLDKIELPEHAADSRTGLVVHLHERDRRVLASSD
jgi:type IV secretory pathway TraG/TraD family ATPase VirD4